jgi:hypothetical protein
MHRDVIKKRVLHLLQKHRGKENAISAKVLYCLATEDSIVPVKAHNQTRIIRSIVNECRMERIPILSGNGYWMAESDEDLRLYVESALDECARAFRLNSNLSRIPVDRMVEQLKLKLTELESDDD